MTISVRWGARYFQIRVGPRWAAHHDNGALISCGLTVGERSTRGREYLSERSMRALIVRGAATEISESEWRHSGCQSSCVQRGNVTCRW